MAASFALPVIVNASGGTAAALGDDLGNRLRNAFAKSGRTIALDLVEGADVAGAIIRSAKAPRVVVGGGDGTLATAAGILSRSGSEMAVLPLGTLNHFARQLDIPLDLEAAADLAANGSTRTIDLACAGERTFINNASFGAYIELLQRRERSELPKWIANIVEGLRTLQTLRAVRFDLEIDDERKVVSTAQLFIGNNRYEIPEGKPGKRQALDDGLLSIFALAPLGRIATVRSGLAVVLGSPNMDRDFALETTARKLRIHGCGMIDFALDGEPHRAVLPLELEIRPKALSVVATRN